MNQLRLDPLSGRWVVVSPGRSERPYSFVTRTPYDPGSLDRPCPFCPGNEEDTPPALETYGPTGRWLVRVVPNLYPAFEGDEPFVVANRGPVFTQASAGGIHEILIFSPEHDATLGQLSQEQVELVIAALRDRLEEHASQPNLRYTQAIVNSGREAGASLEHPHGQLLGMSFIPRELAEEQARFAALRRLLPLVHHHRGGGGLGRAGDLRQRPGGGGLPLLECRPLRDAGHAPGAQPPSPPEPDRGPGGRRRGHPPITATAGRIGRGRGVQHRLPLGALPGR